MNEEFLNIFINCEIIYKNKYKYLNFLAMKGEKEKSTI